MNSKKLRAIANSCKILDGAVTVWMIPIVTLRHNIAVTKAQELFSVPDGGWGKKSTDAQLTFCLLEGSLVDVEINETDDDLLVQEAIGVKTYHDNRNGDMAHNWDLFVTCLTSDTVYELSDAYTETRRKIPKIEAEILKEPPPDIQTDPKETGSGRKRGKKKSVST